MIKLYSMPGSCSLASHIALIWADVDYEVELMKRDDLAKADFLAKNPNGAVPVVEDGDWLLTQNVAILSYIACLNENINLGPKTHSSKDWAQFYRVLGYLNSDFHGTFIGIFAPQVLGFKKGEESASIEASKKRIQFYLKQIDQTLADDDYIYDNRKTVCDAYLWVMLTWVNSTLEGLLSKYPNVKNYFDDLAKDEAVQQAMKEEGLI